jgi:hypothetical protein
LCCCCHGFSDLVEVRVWFRYEELLRKVCSTWPVLRVFFAPSLFCVGSFKG